MAERSTAIASRVAAPHPRQPLLPPALTFPFCSLPAHIPPNPRPEGDQQCEHKRLPPFSARPGCCLQSRACRRSHPFRKPRHSEQFPRDTRKNKHSAHRLLAQKWTWPHPLGCGSSHGCSHASAMLHAPCLSLPDKLALQLHSILAQLLIPAQDKPPEEQRSSIPPQAHFPPREYFPAHSLPALLHSPGTPTPPCTELDLLWR